MERRHHLNAVDLAQWDSTRSLFTSADGRCQDWEFQLEYKNRGIDLTSASTLIRLVLDNFSHRFMVFTIS